MNYFIFLFIILFNTCMSQFKTKMKGKMYKLIVHDNIDDEIGSRNEVIDFLLHISET